MAESEWMGHPDDIAYAMVIDHAPRYGGVDQYHVQRPKIPIKGAGIAWHSHSLEDKPQCTLLMPKIFMQTLVITDFRFIIAEHIFVDRGSSFHAKEINNLTFRADSNKHTP
jgi:hypothetical protein